MRRFGASFDAVSPMGLIRWLKQLWWQWVARDFVAIEVQLEEHDLFSETYFIRIPLSLIRARNGYTPFTTVPDNARIRMRVKFGEEFAYVDDA